TQKGEELLPAFDDISEWGEKWMSEDGGAES
ncbi:transcriptional regulator, partial [Haloferax volcanii]